MCMRIQYGFACALVPCLEPFLFLREGEKFSTSSWHELISGVLGSMVKECGTMILIKEIDISRLMVHSQHIEMAKIRERERQKKRARTGSFNFNYPKSKGGNRS